MNTCDKRAMLLSKIIFPLHTIFAETKSHSRVRRIDYTKRAIDGASDKCHRHADALHYIVLVTITAGRVFKPDGG